MDPITACVISTVQAGVYGGIALALIGVCGPWAVISEHLTSYFSDVTEESSGQEGEIITWPAYISCGVHITSLFVLFVVSLSWGTSVCGNGGSFRITDIAPVPKRGPQRLGLAISFEDGCSRTEARGPDDNCHSLFQSSSKGICPNPLQWFVLQFPKNEVDVPRGYCDVRLCGKGRVYVSTVQKCYSLLSRDLCSNDKRLWITAFGTPICDCYEGAVPDLKGKCHLLFTQGPCPKGQVWIPSGWHFGAPEGRCTFDNCYHVRSPGLEFSVPIVKVQDGGCHQFGTRANCPEGMVLAFVVFLATVACVTLRSAGYSADEEELRILSFYYPESLTAAEKQDMISPLNTVNVGTVIDSLLIPCRDGARRDINFKCRDTIIPGIDSVLRNVSVPSAINSPFTCFDECISIQRKCVACDKIVEDACNFSQNASLLQEGCDTLQNLG